MTLADQAVPEDQYLVDKAADLLRSLITMALTPTYVPTSSNCSSGTRCSARVQYARSASLPRTTPPLSWSTRAATGR